MVFFMNVYRYGHFGDIRCSRCITGVNDTGGKWKIFKLKNFNNFVWAPLGSRVNIYINFCLQVHFKVSAAKYRRQFATGVIDTSGKFATRVVDTGGAP
jgi:hypothetical protein